ncbi:type III restriction enzyme, res subunit [Citrifermentans bremense]|uniref:Type III restriction enzyme, res subunit n=1 Tax=Citrifermentans bremense TaxID=60035 RepID=A0A6S6M0L4_9BACT|nr:DEAD/DEAH box helicase family protein [Citrifermentans bremense]BCG47079.1 type III restriction enzyme, res subunit [Citrifermentans bremense]
MLTPKEYQTRTLETLKQYFATCQKLGDADTAFYNLTKQIHGIGIPYREVKELPGLPYVCLRIPTGGGKTLVACHSIGIAANDLLHADAPVVLWLVPSNAIKDQTISALKDRKHPYRQALEEASSSVSVLSVQEALYVTRPTLTAGTTVIVSTMQAFRVDETEGRKVYEQSGALMDHFTGIEPALLASLEKHEDGKPVTSLANLLRLHRPVVIVDEAHNARTTLSFETLARFNPSCILEFTATPDTEASPSNVLHSVSAAELKADNMIKLPIRLETRPSWKELVGDAIALRQHLEELAVAERKATGEYIRPIVLLQAQPQAQHQDRLTVEVVEQCLLEDFAIPAEHIRRATGTDKGLEGLNLSLPSCDVRYIITVQALREGWDCPFAYVLCSVAEMRSSTAVEQILGRIMRLPSAKRKLREELNMSYAFAASQNFIEAANALEDALVQNGFNRQEAKDLIGKMPEKPQGGLEQFWTTSTETVKEVPKLDTLPASLAQKVTYDAQKGELTFTGVMDENEKVALQSCVTTPEAKASIERVFKKSHGLGTEKPKSPAERGEPFSLPVLSIKQGNLFEAFEQTHFLEMPWKLSECDPRLTEAEFSEKHFDGKVVEIDISDKGKLAQRFIPELQSQMSLIAQEKTQTVANLVYWLDRTIPHPDITPSETGPFLTAVVLYLVEQRGFKLSHLYHDKYTLRQKVTEKIEQHRQQAQTLAYQSLLLPECPTPLVVNPNVCFSFMPHEYPYNTRYEGSYQFKKHYYKEVGNLKHTGEEYDCAVFLDTLPEVKFWVRNIERRERHSFSLQTTTDKFYPDFVAMLTDGRYLVVEYKGQDRWSNDDSKEKRALGELWEKRSGGSCLFIMPNGKDLEAIRMKAQS